MKKVLVVSYYFPPMGLSGVQRTQKFVKYLPQFGWLPTVLTISRAEYLAFDPSLLDELPEEVEILRTASADVLSLMRLLTNNRQDKQGGIGVVPSERVRGLFHMMSQFFFIPDNKIGWLPFALSKGNRLLLNEHFDLIYSSAPPYTCHLIACALKSLRGVPLVLDFRDDWTQNQFIVYPTFVHKIANGMLEREVLQRASAIISTNELMSSNLQKRHPLIKSERFKVISHGFDPDDFGRADNIEEECDPPIESIEGRKFTITYTGSFYERITPLYFLLALREILDENPDFADQIKALFVGMFREENEALVQKLKLQDVVEVVAYVKHRESVNYLMESDLLWMMVGKGKLSQTISAGKLYEYIGSRKPILACVPRGGVDARVVRSTGNGMVVPPDDVQAIKGALLSYYSKYADGQLRLTPVHVVEKYGRKRLTEELARIFDSCI